MQFTSSERTDLVISMTLAEIFLLVLFVIWFGYTKILIDPNSKARLMEQLERYKKNNQSLSAELSEAKNKIEDLTRRLEIWRDLTGFDHPPSSQEFDGWIKEACRSNPKCEGNNVLIQATVTKGNISMILLTKSPRLSEWFSTHGRRLPETGVKIDGLDKIQPFLNSIREFYSENIVNEKECRFDYNLTYGSKEDYFDGRELFERYFYPAKLRQAGLD